MAQLSFNANEVKPNEPMGPVPEGQYVVQIVESEMKATKSGNGRYLALTLKIQEGEYKDRKIFDNLNIENQSATAQQIARGNLSAICHAVGTMNIQDSQQLHNLPFLVDVKCKKGTDGNGNETMNNDIKGYHSRSKVQTVPVDTAAGNTAPWNAVS